jgi:predicted dehydrogenase
MNLEESPIRVGIAGLGRSGWDIHAALLSRVPELFRVSAIFDGLEARRDQARARFDCRAHVELSDLLTDQDVELVVMALPSHLHAPATLAALEQGKHVVCEKPMAISLADADTMITAARAAQRVLTVFHQRRYNPDFAKVREVIDSGILGRIVQIRLTESRFSRRWDWQTLQKFGGGTLNNTGPHFLDFALQLFGPEEPEIFCNLDRTLTLGDADDHVKLVLKPRERGSGAPTVDVEISSACAYPPETWLVMGTHGGLAGSTKSLRWRWIVPDTLPPRTLDLNPTPDRSYNRDTLEWQESSWEITGTQQDAYVGFYRDLFRTIRLGEPLVVTPESARRVMWLIDRCHTLSPLSQTIF